MKLCNTFNDPVVIAKSAGFEDPDPALVRIRNVDGNGFEICLQEWEYQDGSHGREYVSFLVLERGCYTLKDGTRIEAGKFTADNADSFASVGFSHTFKSIPFVIAAANSTGLA